MLAQIRFVTALLGCMLLAWARPVSGVEPASAAPRSCQAAPYSNPQAAAGYRVTRAELRTQPGAAEVCDLTLQSRSKSVFRVSMPAKDWNGALIEARCDAECRQSMDSICASVIARGYACFAANPKTAGVAHESLAAAKAIVTAYYRAAPQAAVLLACSAGAGTGLQQAAEFPADFQGIVAGAPILDDTEHRRRLRWLADTLRSPRGKPLLTPDDLARLHAQALAACDTRDGLADGLISDPLRCQVPVQALECSAAPDRSCFRHEQIEAIRRIYSGPLAQPTAGQLPGSELGWAQIPKPDAAAPATPSARDALQPDLQKFAAAGGKLLLFQGLTDPLVAPRQTAQRYERWTETLGGPVKATEFVRLFLVPGMNHCGGGEGPYQIDFLRGIENWTVKARRAPDDLIAFHPRAEAASSGSLFAPAGIDPAHNVFSSWQVGVSVTLAESRDHPHSSFSRPIYLYPVHTHYKGVGDPNVWRSFYGPSDYPSLTR